MSGLSSPERVLRALQEARARVEAAEGREREPIAVIGMGCRFPGGVRGPEDYWRLLGDGVDAVGEIPRDRWDVERYYDSDPEAPGKMYTRAGGFLDEIDRFDAFFFGIVPREAERMDPQQRILLEVSREALENAGHASERLNGSQTGIFVGMGSDDYLYLRLLAGRESLDAYTGLGTSRSIAAGRIAYALGCHGPTLQLDTSCSSSLLAVHLACQSLRARECEVALAGGINLMLSPESTITLCKLRALAADGRSKTFDARADGYSRGEGCGMVVLKPLARALDERDHIFAVIRGSAVNHDGHSNGLTAPNGSAQEAVIRRALQSARVEPAEVGYVEVHGTGTYLGDPIEVLALANVFAPGRSADAPLTIGSVKTNFGHLEAAAGIAGFMKTVLALVHGEIPPHLHFRDPNPNIPWDRFPIAVPTRRSPWPRGEQPRLAGISSFGMSGTNVHVVLGEAPPAALARTSPLPASGGASLDRPLHLVALSARSEDALRQTADRFRDFLAVHPDLPIADVAFSANAGRSHFEHRLALIAETTAGLVKTLEGLEGGGAAGVTRGRGQGLRRPRLAFLFTGQGSQYTGMGRQLYRTQPLFRDVLQRAQDVLRPCLERPLLSVLYPEPGQASPLDQTAYAQPALFAFEFALAELWASWGVEPDVVMGHDVGEYVAACRAGVFSLEEALTLIAASGPELPTRALRLPLISCLSGQRLEPGDTLDAEYWRQRPWVAPRWKEGLQTLLAEAPAVVLEIGPHPALAEAAATHLPEAAAGWLPSLRRGGQDWQVLLETLSLLYAQNVTVDWNGFDRDYVRCKVPLPTYPFERTRYWMDGAERTTSGPVSLPLPSGAGTADGPRDWLYELHWPLNGRAGRGPDAVVPEGRSPGTWLIFADRGGVGQHLAQALTARGEECVRIFPGEEYDDSTPGRYRVRPGEADDFRRLLQSAFESAQPACRGVVHLWSLDAAPTEHLDLPALQAAQLLGCGSALHLVQALARTTWREAPRLWLVTQGAQAVGPTPTAVAAAQAPLWGCGRAVAHEHPALWGGLSDLEVGAPPGISASHLIEEVSSPDGEDQVAFRQGQRHVARLVPAKVEAAGASAYRCRDDGTYLITGGLGALGLRVAEWLVRRGARRLVLGGRSGASKAAQEAVGRLEQAGAQVVIVQADIARAEDAARLLRVAQASLLPLRGVVHAAGVLEDGTLLGQTWERWRRPLSSKVDGTWNLHVVTRDLPLDFFVCFSSMAALLGPPGQANYAAANTFMDVLVSHRRSLGLPGLSVNWGPWLNAGMVGAHSRRLAESGLTPLDPERALDTLGVLLSPGDTPTQLGVVTANWSRLVERFGAGATPRLLTELTQGAPQDAGHAQQPGRTSALLRHLGLAPAHEHRALVARFLLGELGQVMGLDPDHWPDPKRGFADMGMDSLMAVELKNRLERTLGMPLPATLAFEYPTVQDLAEYLAAQVPGVLSREGNGFSAGSRTPSSAEPRPAFGAARSGCQDPDAATLDIDALSLDEVDQLLASQVAKLEMLLRQS